MIKKIKLFILKIQIAIYEYQAKKNRKGVLERIRKRIRKTKIGLINKVGLIKPSRINYSICR